MTPKEKTEIQELIEKSGHSFHSRVVKLLREEKWTVLVSPYYSDNFTDKPREIDVIAEKAFDVKDYGEWLGSLNVRLFVECKYVTGKTVFWFDSKDKERAVERIMADTGLDHPSRNINIQKHHYFFDVPVAKLFTSEKSRNEENEIISKAINQNLNAMVYYRDRTDLIPKNRKLRENVLSRVSYPIIVVNSFENFYRTNMADEKGEVEPITEPFQLEVNYAYMDKDKKSRNEFFLVDVVSFEKLPSFLEQLKEVDIPTISYHVEWQETEARRELRNNQDDNSGGFISVM